MPMRKVGSLTVAMVATTALVVAAASNCAMADPPLEVAQSSLFGEDKLRAFAAAFLAVERVRDDYDGALEAADTEEGRRALRREAQEEMASAVEDVPGISVGEYNAIFQAAGSDPALAARVERMISAARQ